MTTSGANTDDPPWVASLAVLVSLPPDVAELSPPLMLDEIDEWLARARPEPWKLNRASLRGEVDRSLSLFGPALRSTLQPALGSYKRAASALLSDDTPPAEERRALASLSEELHQALREPPAIRSAWRDLLSEAKSPSTDPAKCIKLLHVLSGQMRLRGVEPASRLRDVANYLTGHHFALRANLEERDNGSGSDANLFADLSERIRLAEEELLRSPQSAHCVVWLQYDFARVPDCVYSAGNVTFFDAPWALPNARLDDGQLFLFRDELRALLDSHDYWWTDQGPESSSAFVVARVDLGAHLTDSALERAETIVQSLVTVATTWSGGIRWRQSGPACVVADGRVVLDSRRHDAFRGYVDNLGINITSDELNDQARPLAEAMAETHLPPELEESLRLLAEAGSEDSRETNFGSTKHLHERSAIVLRDQAVEHVAALADMTVRDLDNELMLQWAHSRWGNSTWSAINQILRRSWEQEGVRDLSSRIRGNGQRGSVMLFPVASREEQRLLSLCETSAERQTLRSLMKGMRSAPHYLRLAKSYDQYFQLLIDRHRRIRNALVHGNPAHPRVVTTVTAVSRMRSDHAVQLALDAFTRKITLGELLAERRDEHSETEAELETGRSWLTIWEG